MNLRPCSRSAGIGTQPLKPRKETVIMAETRTYKNELDLKAYLNELTPDIDTDYTVKVNTKDQTLTDDDIASDVAILSGKHSKSEVKLIFDFQAQAMAAAVANGYNIATQLCYVQPTASGVIMEEDLSAPVDRTKVKVYASLRPGTALKQAMEQTKLKLFMQPAATGPHIAGMTSAEFTDADATTRAPMGASGMAVIAGNGLKLVGGHASVGITLTSVATPSKSFFIPAARVSPNTPKKLQFVLPAGITEGQWMVKVTTQYAGSSHQTKEPRTFELKRPIYIGIVPDGGGTGGDGDDNENPLG